MSTSRREYLPHPRCVAFAASGALREFHDSDADWTRHFPLARLGSCCQRPRHGWSGSTRTSQRRRRRSQIRSHPRSRGSSTGAAQHLGCARARRREFVSLPLRPAPSDHLLQVNRLACLRLTERCATILISIREEIAEAGDEVGLELQPPLDRLVEYVHLSHPLRSR